MPRTSAPASVWLAAVTLCATIVGLTGILVPPEPMLLPESLLAHGASPKSKTVVIVGTSLVGHAFPPDDVMRSLAKRRGLENVEFFRLAVSERDLERRNPVFEALERHPPDLVLIEDKLLFYAEPWLRSEKNRIRKFARSAIYNVPPDTYATYESWVQSNFARVRPVRGSKDWEAVAEEERPRRGFAPTAPLDHMLRRAAAEGVPVVVLHLPFAAEVEAFYPADDRAYEERVRGNYQEAYAVEALEYPESLDAAWFVDGVHLNLEGRERLTTWFIDWVTQRTS